jgi:hypothetical protein
MQVMSLLYFPEVERLKKVLIKPDLFYWVRNNLMRNIHRYVCRKLHMPSSKHLLVVLIKPKVRQSSRDGNLFYIFQKKTIQIACFLKVYYYYVDHSGRAV